MNFGTALVLGLLHSSPNPQASIPLASSAMPPLLQVSLPGGLPAHEAPFLVCRELEIMLF